MEHITIIGTGYIGLVTGTCLAEFGNNVICVDIDHEKINALHQGIIPIYEPGLHELVLNNVEQKRLSFSTDIAASIKQSTLIFIAVNTPMAHDGTADITAVKQAAKTIAQNLNEQKIVCIRSTVPVGTHAVVDKIINGSQNNFHASIVSIPEFLREGSAIHDFCNPDRIIIGTQSHDAYEILKKLFLKTNCLSENIVHVDNACAETIKYVSNSFLALKVSFINEIAQFCDTIGVDVYDVAHGTGLDKRIGNQFLRPGPGFGGSCFPKDVIALLKMAENAGIDLKTIRATLEINEQQKQFVVKKLKNFFNGTIRNKVITILGLAFKANTDDIRQTPALSIIKELQQAHCIIKVYDPQAMPNMKQEITDILYCNDAYQAAQDADALLILTEWKEFAELNFETIAQIMKQKNILDTRNILNISTLKKLNFTVETIGRNCKANLSYFYPSVAPIFKTL